MSAKGTNPLKYRKYIGVRVAVARRELGMTQAELAKLLGITRVSLSSYESGRLRFKIHTLMSLAQILNKPLSYFVHSFESDANKYDPSQFPEVEPEMPKQLEFSVEEEIEFALEMSIRNYLRSLGYKKATLEPKLKEVLDSIKTIPKFEKPKKLRNRISGTQYIPY